MTLPAVGDAAYPKPSELRNQALSDVFYSSQRQDLTPSVEPGSDLYIRMDAVARRACIAIANNKIALEDFSPLTATGEALDDLSETFGVSRRAASSASGTVVVGVVSGSVTIPEGFQCTAPNGEVYETVAAKLVSDNGFIEVIATGTGSATNQIAGTVLNWNEASIGLLKPTCTVGETTAPFVGDIDGGEDADNDERLRERLLRRLAFPAAGGNWSEVAQWAEESTASVGSAFVHNAVRGPATYDVVVVKDGGDRSLSATVCATVASYIVGKMPGHADLNVTSVTPNYEDVILNMKLPLPINSGGAGGGWRDAAPWPSTADAVIPRVTNRAGNVLTVNSTSADAPVAGKHFGIWDYVNSTMREFVIQSVGGVSGAYTVTIDSGLSDPLSFITDGAVASGFYLSAGSTNLKNYATDFLAAMEELGPGEKTSSADILPRGRRRPGPDEEHPAALTAVQLGVLADAHPEVLDVSYAARYASGTTSTQLTPPVPATTADPPGILVLRHFAIRYTS